ncbi:hypothetical protein PoB_004166400 [Plakobranchus ocellatus]|uniref:Uncharacterized protein n=1 Tax=Plakobranchus ocellatus TaxID=259542 RepID=A0AAV4B8Y9_9GAST|nr:hypothetical protein PoB_004166400 [Plakobranchus ocellatus]
MPQLATVKALLVVTNCAASGDPGRIRDLLVPILRGEIGSREVDVMRDIGCEAVVVRKGLVDKSDCSGGATELPSEAEHFYDFTARQRKFFLGDKVLIFLPNESYKLLIQ